MAFSSWKTWTTGETVTAAELNQDIRDNGEALFPDEEQAIYSDATVGSDWIPIVTGDGATQLSLSDIDAAHYRMGAIVFCWFRGFFDGNKVGQPAGDPLRVNLPYDADALVGVGGAGTAIGSWRFNNSGGPSSNATGACFLMDFDEVRFGLADGRWVTDGDPHTVADGDSLTFFVAYPIDVG